jgi:predicted nucleotidyltransferase component of viral defense system
MNLFDELVTTGLSNQPQLSPLRIVVEKELLHHDILRILSQHHYLKNLTFIGGTCLRCCYGAIRLSEDLDFTGGNDFNRDELSQMGKLLIEKLEHKYGLRVNISEPIKDKSNVDTWKIKIETRPEEKHLPAQRINIDICAVPSYEKQAMMLLNPYRVDMGTQGLILQAQSREEIYTDKLLAFALRANRIKYRDIWDIMWLHQQGFKPKLELIPLKLQDRNLTLNYFLNLFAERTQALTDNNKIVVEFKQEMQRFLPANDIHQVIDQDDLWPFISYLMADWEKQILKIFA